MQGTNAVTEGVGARPEKMFMTLMDEHARQKLGVSETWFPYHYEHVDPDLILITGMEAPLHERGKNRGHPNFRKGDRATKRKTGFSTREHYQFQCAWERSTGKCANCLGSGKTLASAHVNGDRTYRACFRCNSSGDAPVQQGQANSGS